MEQAVLESEWTSQRSEPYLTLDIAYPSKTKKEETQQASPDICSGAWVNSSSSVIQVLDGEESLPILICYLNHRVMGSQIAWKRHIILKYLKRILFHTSKLSSNELQKRKSRSHPYSGSRSESIRMNPPRSDLFQTSLRSVICSSDKLIGKTVCMRIIYSSSAIFFLAVGTVV